MALVKKDSNHHVSLAPNKYYCCADGRYLTYPTMGTSGYCCNYYHDRSVDCFNRGCCPLSQNHPIKARWTDPFTRQIIRSDASIPDPEDTSARTGSVVVRDACGGLLRRTDTTASTRVGRRLIGAGATVHDVMFASNAAEEAWMQGV